MELKFKMELSEWEIHQCFDIFLMTLFTKSTTFTLWKENKLSTIFSWRDSSIWCWMIPLAPIDIILGWRETWYFFLCTDHEYFYKTRFCSGHIHQDLENKTSTKYFIYQYRYKMSTGCPQKLPTSYFPQKVRQKFSIFKK